MIISPSNKFNFVLRGYFEIPPDWEPNLPVALYLPLAGATDPGYSETLVYIDGTAYAASDLNHPEILLAADWADGQSHRLTLHGWLRDATLGPADKWTQPSLHPCAVVQIDQPTRDFIATARVALGVATRLNENEPAQGHLLNALDEAFKLLDTREPFGEAFYASVPPAHAALRAGIHRFSPGLAHPWMWTSSLPGRSPGCGLAVDVGPNPAKSGLYLPHRSTLA